jgi:hypothetical protein
VVGVGVVLVVGVGVVLVELTQHFLDTCISFWKNVLVFSDRCTSVLQMGWLGELVSNIDLLIYCFSIPSEQKILGNLPPHGP